MVYAIRIHIMNYTYSYYGGFVAGILIAFALGQNPIKHNLVNLLFFMIFTYLFGLVCVSFIYWCLKPYEHNETVPLSKKRKTYKLRGIMVYIKGLYLMNEFDKRLFTALKFFADNTNVTILNIRQENMDWYRRQVPTDMEEYLSRMDYISLNRMRYIPPAGTGQGQRIITYAGLTELRKLEEIRYRDRVVIIALIALLLSLYTFAKTQGWI